MLKQVITMPDPGTALVVSFELPDSGDLHYAVRAFPAYATDIWIDDLGKHWPWVELLHHVGTVTVEL